MAQLSNLTHHSDSLYRCCSSYYLIYDLSCIRMYRNIPKSKVKRLSGYPILCIDLTSFLLVWIWKVFPCSHSSLPSKKVDGKRNRSLSIYCLHKRRKCPPYHQSSLLKISLIQVKKKNTQNWTKRSQFCIQYLMRGWRNHLKTTNVYVEEPWLQFEATLWLSYPVNIQQTPYPYILYLPAIHPPNIIYAIPSTLILVNTKLVPLK